MLTVLNGAAGNVCACLNCRRQVRPGIISNGGVATAATPATLTTMLQAAPMSIAADGVATFVPDGVDGCPRWFTSSVVQVVD